MNKWLVGLVVLAAGVGVGWYILQGAAGTPVTPDSGVEQTVVPTGEPVGGEATGNGGAVEQMTVTYTDSGFVPNSVTVKKGTTVKFINESSGEMWVASALHPTHQLLPGFDQLKSVSKGGTYGYVFEKVGTWKYHNHVAAADTGVVVVTE
ncbi:hypothetical protein HY950_04130 [Candidatus Gottesmanbacteria bacterium]|nr:hypothetical protein [Candidatus Gottesmanbacteria bacterium]